MANEILQLIIVNNPEKQIWLDEIHEQALQAARTVFGDIRILSEISDLKLKPNRNKAVLSWKIEIPGNKNLELIAKLNEMDGALMEYFIYTNILPDLGLDALECFGMVEDESKEFAWIFMEHAGHHRYNADIGEHVRLATEWLSVLHGSQIRPELIKYFEACGDQHYAASLTGALRYIESGMANPVLSSEQLKNLAYTLRLLEMVEKKWTVVMEMCSAVPQCLIHGDFLSKNLRIDDGGEAYRLKVLDWDAACLGFPFLDIAEALLPTSGWQSFHPEHDLSSYINSSVDWWPGINVGTLHRLIGIGQIFWALECIYGDGSGLNYNWVDKIADNIHIYSRILDNGIHTAKL